MLQSESVTAAGDSATGPVFVLAGTAVMLLFLGLNSPQAAMAMALAAFTVLIVWAAWRVQSDTFSCCCARS